MTRFRTKPFEIEAVRWTGDNHAEILEFMTGAPPAIEHEGGSESWVHRCAEVDRLGLTVTGHQGDVVANAGDWIIAEPDGKGHYPCDPDTFTRKYEPAE